MFSAQPGLDCVKALDEQNSEKFDGAMETLAAAQTTSDQLDDRIEELIRPVR